MIMSESVDGVIKFYGNSGVEPSGVWRESRVIAGSRAVAALCTPLCYPPLTTIFKLLPTEIRK